MKIIAPKAYFFVSLGIAALYIFWVSATVFDPIVLYQKSFSILWSFLGYPVIFGPAILFFYGFYLLRGTVKNKLVVFSLIFNLFFIGFQLFIFYGTVNFLF